MENNNKMNEYELSQALDIEYANAEENVDLQDFLDMMDRRRNEMLNPENEKLNFNNKKEEK